MCVRMCVCSYACERVWGGAGQVHVCLHKSSLTMEMRCDMYTLIGLYLDNR